MTGQPLFRRDCRHQGKSNETDNGGKDDSALHFAIHNVILPLVVVQPLRARERSVPSAERPVDAHRAGLAQVEGRALPCWEIGRAHV
mgnify:CR=1 FL=1